MREYLNVPLSIATCISSNKATLHELDTVYGLEDLYDLLEIVQIDAHNNRVMTAKP